MAKRIKTLESPAQRFVSADPLFVYSWSSFGAQFVSVFTDDIFKLLDDLDNSKTLQFQLEGLDPDDDVVWDVQGKSGTVMLHGDSHTLLTDIGTNTHPAIDTHIADATLHFTEASIDHTAITNIGSNSHAAIDTHLADNTIHFTEASIDHTAITNIGSNTHAQIDTHLADATLHFTEASIDHTAITNIGSNTHAQIDTHIADSVAHVPTLTPESIVFVGAGGGLSEDTTFVRDAATGNIGIGTASPTHKFHVRHDTSGVAGFKVENQTAGANAQIQTVLANDAGRFAYFGLPSSTYTQAPVFAGCANFGGYQVDTLLWTQTAGKDVIIATGGIAAANRRVWFTDGGTGFGTDSPGAKLHVVGDADEVQLSVDANSAQSNDIFQVRDSAGVADIMAVDAVANIYFGVSSSVRNEVWHAAYNAIKMGTSSMWTIRGVATYAWCGLGENVYMAASNLATYLLTDMATQYRQKDGFHDFRVAPSGTAGTTINFIDGLRITNEGKVGINNIAPELTLHVENTSTFVARFDGNTGNAFPAVLHSDGGGAGISNAPNYSNETIYMSEGSIGFQTDGARRMTLLTSGVGIGTFTPGATAHVVGSADQVQLSVDANGPQTANIVEIRNNAGTDLVVVDNTGKFGVGIGSPTHKLHVRHDTSGVAGFKVENQTGGALAQIQNVLVNDVGFFAYYGIGSNTYTQAPVYGNNAFFGAYRTGAVFFTQTAGKDLIFATGGTTLVQRRMRITDSGIVVGENGSPGNGQFTIVGRNDEVQLSVDANATQTANIVEIRDDVGGRLVTVSGDGNLGVGTANPDQLIHAVSSTGQAWLSVQSNGAATAGMYFNASGQSQDVFSLDTANNLVFRNVQGSHSGSIFFDFKEAVYFRDGAAGFAYRLAVATNGEIGVGTISPAARVHVDGSVDEVQFMVDAHSTQTANIVEIRDDVGADLVVVTSAGQLEVANQVKIEGGSPGALKILTDVGGTGLATWEDHPLFQFFNGTFVERVTGDMTSDGAVVTFEVENADLTNDLTMRFGDGFTTFDTTPAATCPATPGSDASPTTNYFFIPQSTKALTCSVSGWPSETHIRIAFALVPSAAEVQADGPYAFQFWNDGSSAEGHGHMAHIGEHIRSSGAVYHSGVDPNGTTEWVTITGGSPDTIHVKATAGVVYQLHAHPIPAQDTSAGSHVHVVNHNTTPYVEITDLATQTADSAGAALSNKYYTLVIWGAANKGGTYSPLFCNLPTGSYSNQAEAESDQDKHTVYDIPAEFVHESSTGFLIFEVLLKHSPAGGGTWTHMRSLDLRGQTPGAAAGGGAGGAVTEFADNQFTLFDEADLDELTFQLSSLSANRVVTALDTDGVMALSDAALTVESIPFIDASGRLTEDTTFVRDAGTGNIGIGTNDPDQALDMADGSIELASTTAVEQGVIFKDGTAFIHDFHHPTGDSAVPTGNNLFIGADAGNFTMGSTATATFHASSNTAFGNQALSKNTIGNSNVAIGKLAMRDNTTGSWNMAMGANSLKSNTVGSYNMGVGSEALYAKQSGHYNVGVGYRAGRYLTDAATPLTTTDNSVYIGTFSMGLSDPETNAIVIGYQAEGLGSNTVVLGNDSILTTALKGDVGIGTTAPGATAHIVGSADQVQFSVDANATQTANIFEIRNHLGTDWGYMSSGGDWWVRTSMAIGAAPNPLITLYVNKNTNNPTGHSYGGQFKRTMVLTADNDKSLIGNYCFVTANAAAYNLTGALGGGRFNGDTALSGTTASVYGGSFEASNSAAGTVSDLSAGKFQLINFNAGGVVTDAYGVHVLPITNAGTITNTYGVYVGDITAGTQTNTPFSFYAADANALNYFAGNVGIGTAAPGAKLVVSDSVAGDSYVLVAENTSTDASATTIQSLKLYGTDAVGTDAARLVAGKAQSWTAVGNTRDGYLAFEVAVNDTPTEFARINSDGRFGVGTTAPVALVHAQKDANTAASIRVENDDTGTAATASFIVETGANQTALTSYSTASSSSRWGQSMAGMSELAQAAGNGLAIGTVSSDELILGTAATMAVYIDTSQQVGIGTDSPDRELHVYKNQDTVTRVKVENDNSGTSSRADVRCVSDGAEVSIGVGSSTYTGVANWQDAGFVGSNSNAGGGLKLRAAVGGIGFSTDGGTTDDNVYIDTDGKVGIGTGSPINRLHVSDTSDGASLFTSDSSGHTASNGLYVGYTTKSWLWNYEATDLVFGTSNATRMTLDSNGDLGVGGGPNSSYIAYFTGDVGVTGTMSDGLSDVRVKTDVLELDGAASLQALMQMRPVDFEFLEEPFADANVPPPKPAGERNLGFIAQEIEGLFPCAVVEHTIGSSEGPVYKNIIHKELLPPVVAATQEIARRAKDLKDQLDAAKDRVQTLETQMAQAIARIQALEAA